MKRDLQGVERVETVVERPQERLKDAKDASNEKLEEENLQSLIQRRAGSTGAGQRAGELWIEFHSYMIVKVDGEFNYFIFCLHIFLS